MAGRNTSCTQEVIDNISMYLREGLPRGTACRLAGICLSTFYAWIDRARKNEPLYVEFLHSIERAEDEFERYAVKTWIEAASDLLLEDDNGVARVARKGDWKALESFLKRTRQKSYSEQTMVRLRNDVKNMSALEKLENLSSQIIDQISEGEMSVESGNLMLKAIDDRRKLIETIELEKRLTAIEEKLPTQ